MARVCPALEQSYAPCDLCDAVDPALVLRSPRLDGPLVRCRACSLHYVGRRGADFTFRQPDAARSAALADRVSELGLVRLRVEHAERPWRLAAERERVARLCRHRSAGRLLDVGCALGHFLEVAGERFDAVGVEPDPSTSAQARAAGLSVITGTLAAVTAPPGGFDVVTLLHVIEHLDSPHRTLQRVSRLLAPGGVVMIETPTIDSVWFRHAPQRWRQLIPDHYFFFSRATLSALLYRCGLQPIEHVTVGRRVSARFLADRLRRSGLPFSSALGRGLRRAGIEDRSVRINPGDIMQVIAAAP